MSINLWQGDWRGETPVGSNHQLFREVVRPTGGILRGKFPCCKTERMVQHEGMLELDTIYGKEKL